MKSVWCRLRPGKDARMRHDHRAVVRNIFGDDAIGADPHIVPDMNPSYEHRSGSDFHIVADDRGTALSAADGYLMENRAVFPDHCLVGKNDSFDSMRKMRRFGKLSTISEMRAHGSVVERIHALDAKQIPRAENLLKETANFMQREQVSEKFHVPLWHGLFRKLVSCAVLGATF